MRHTILMIDDQWSMQELARIILQGAGYRVLLAGDGITGLSLARLEHPSVVILDLCLPEMSGQDVLRIMRDDPHTAAIPVIVITPANYPALIDPRPVADAYLQKPFDPATLLLTINRMLNRHEMPIAV